MRRALGLAAALLLLLAASSSPPVSAQTREAAAGAQASPTPTATPRARPSPTAGAQASPTPSATPTRARGAVARPRLSPGAAAPDRLIVRLRPGVSEEGARRALSAGGGQVAREIRALGVQVVRVAPEQREAVAARLRALPEVLAVEPDRLRGVLDTPNDPLYPQQWALPKVEAPQAWDVARGSQVKIAILDCGIFSPSSAWGDAHGFPEGHPDVGSKVVLEQDFSASGNTDDYCNHGTHVAGIAAATTNNGLGVAGLAREAVLLNGKVLGDDGSGSESTVAEGIVWAADNGAKVINLSLGGDGPCSATEQSAIDYAWSKGVVIVAAAGNGGAQGATAPANCNHVLAVAATDQNDARASFSNYGAASVDLAAPGVSILSTDYVGQYASFSGTSMATPLVSGLAALVWSTPWGTGNQGVVDRLTSTADQIPGTGTLWQYGRVNARRAVAPPDGTPTTVSIQPPSASVVAGGTTAVTLHAAVPGGASLGAWTVDVAYDRAVVAPVADGCTSTVGSVCNTAFTPTSVRVAGTSTAGLSGAVALASLAFQALGAPGSSSPLTVTVVALADVGGAPLASAAAHGSLEVGQPPSVAAVSPNAGPARGGTAVIVSGTSFQPGATVTVRHATGEAQATSVVVAGTTSLTAVMPRSPERADGQPRAIGDVNGLDGVTSVDALCILRLVAGLGEAPGCPTAALATPVEVLVTNPGAPSASLPGGFTYLHADVNGLGGIDAVDALCVLREVARLPETPACPAVRSTTRSTGPAALPTATLPSASATRPRPRHRPRA